LLVLGKALDYDIGIQVAAGFQVDVPQQRIDGAVDWVLTRHQVLPGTGICIVVMDDAEVRRLNREFRGVDAVTDVLSFSSGESATTEAQTMPYLGDLVLAWPYIQRQAECENHSAADELILAVVHGTLHLLGYDHDTDEHQRVMWAVQAEALGALDIAIDVPLFDLSDDDT
jgi:probable rRNA maturation factor